MQRRIPEGDDRPRHVCEACGTIHYQNPRLVVGCIPEWEDRILLCRRDIEPRRGFWTLPAGFLENGETVEAGACRETFEETAAHVELIQPYAMFNLAFVNQVYLFFRARLLDLNFRPTPESDALELFAESDVPWDALAFEVVKATLQRYFRDRPTGHFPFQIGSIAPR
jgi:ADP-ribose pyrophosphatase YjhB (NUDIX family)